MTNPIVSSPSLDGVSDLVSDHTEQAGIELVYIKQANQIIGNTMTSLTSALDTTQSALNLLSLIQQLHNDVSVSTPIDMPFNYSTGRPTSAFVTLFGFSSANSVSAIDYYTSHWTQGTAPTQGTLEWGMWLIYGAQNGYQLPANFNPKTSPNIVLPFTTATGLPVSSQLYNSIYSFVASAYYANPVSPQFDFSNANAPHFASTLSTLESAKANLAAEITSLSAQTSAMGKGDGSLLYSLKTVYNELPSNNFASFRTWALDGYTTNGSSGGKIEDDLTTAITAAQSLNDSQKESVRSFLFIFQEYYQSASAILTSITQIIEQMAQKISQ